MKFNINNDVKCILTDEGKEVLKKKDISSYSYNYSKDSRELTEQLWVLMNIFGDEIYNGGPQLILNNDIYFS